MSIKEHLVCHLGNVIVLYLFQIGANKERKNYLNYEAMSEEAIGHNHECKWEWLHEKIMFLGVFNYDRKNHSFKLKEALKFGISDTTKIKGYLLGH